MRLTKTQQVRCSFADRAWLGERARKIIRRRLNERNRRTFHLEDYSDMIASWDQFVAHAFRLSAAGRAGLERQVWLPEPCSEDDGNWESREVLLKTIGLIVAATRPQIVVETGVERGYSSATWLVNMARAGTGVLYSIDMPRNGVADPHAYTGQAVPQDLRDDWHLVFGPSRKVLPRLLREVEMIDVFLHDADHAYRAQMEEYHTVWPFLRSGGFLISDDVDNSAFIEFAATTRAASWLLPRPAFGDAVGVLRK